jgi:hypothetical protein
MEDVHGFIDVFQDCKVEIGYNPPENLNPEDNKDPIDTCGI